MDDVGFVLLAAAEGAKLETIARRLSKESIEHRLKDLPKSDTPALGSITHAKKEIFVPEAELMKARAILNDINSGGTGKPKGSPWPKRIIIILINLIIITAIAYFVYSQYLS